MSESTQTQSYTVSGMSCSHCERAVTEAVSPLPGVTGVDVSATTGALKLTVSRPVADEAVATAVEAAGYNAKRVVLNLL